MADPTSAPSPVDRPAGTEDTPDPAGAEAAGGATDALDALVGDWLTVPDVAERLGTDVGKVRRMLQDGLLLAVRRGERRVLSVPARLFDGDAPVNHLQGTVSVLADSGLTGAEAVEWLFTPDDSIQGGSPIEALHSGHKTEVRRRAQALAF
nr:Rv2175c family DNA-binding protein [Angustibacter aerolatus]